jgi:hypothetical protein
VLDGHCSSHPSTVTECYEMSFIFNNGDLHRMRLKTTVTKSNNRKINHSKCSMVSMSKIREIFVFRV